MGYAIEDLIQAFSSLPFQGPIPYSLQYDHGQSSCHLLTICATHGDEVGSLPPALKHFKAFAENKTPFQGKWTLIWGNPKASQLRQRFVEQDLNRLYGQLEASSLEGQRAKDISQIIKQANLFIDFHQTIVPTLVPFYSLRSHPASLDWARALGKIHISLLKSPLAPANDKSAIPKDLKTQTDFAAWHGIPAVTVEIGVKGFNKSSEILADYLFQRSLLVASNYVVSSSGLGLEANLSNFALENPPLSFFECLHKEPFAQPQMKLNPGWKNFSPLQKGDIVGFRDQQTPLAAPYDGVMVFPKYPLRDEDGEAQDPRPEDLYWLANVSQSQSSSNQQTQT